MKFYRIYFLAALTVVLMVSCSESIKKGELDYGEVNPQTRKEKTISIDFNSAARADRNAFLEFEFVDANGRPFNDATFYLHDRVVNGRFKITPDDIDPNGKVKVGIEFPSGATEKEYTGALMLVNASSDLLENITYGDSTNIISIKTNVADVKAQYVVPMPSWQKYIIYSLIIFIACILIWSLVIRNKVFPKMTGTINTPEGAIKLNGFRMYYIYSGSAPKSSMQGFFSTFFSGKIGKKRIMALDDGKNSFILISPQKTPKGVRNRISVSDNSLRLAGQNTLYDTCEYSVTKLESNLKFDFIYSNIKHKQTI